MAAILAAFRFGAPQFPFNLKKEIPGPYAQRTKTVRLPEAESFHKRNCAVDEYHRSRRRNQPVPAAKKTGGSHRHAFVQLPRRGRVAILLQARLPMQVIPEKRDCICHKHRYHPIGLLANFCLLSNLRAGWNTAIRLLLLPSSEPMAKSSATTSYRISAYHAVTDNVFVQAKRFSSVYIFSAILLSQVD